jgi:hypothetical protein
MSCDSHSDWCKKFVKDDPDGKFANGTDNFKKDNIFLLKSNLELVIIVI